MGWQAGRLDVSGRASAPGMALAAVLAFASACSGGDAGNDDGSSRCTFGDAHCGSTIDLLECDPSGDFVATRCVAGETCVEESASSAACLPEGAEHCDLNDFSPKCVDDTTLVECVLRDLVAHTEARTCEAGECFEADGGAICVDAGTVGCDPATFSPACVGDAVTVCRDLGYTWTEEDCAEDGRTCMVHEGEPRCADADATPCDPADLRYEHCADGHVRVCDAASGLTEIVERCEPDGTCIGAECFPGDSIPCDDGDVPYRCGDASTLLRCDTTIGFYRASDCDAGTECRDVGASGGSGACLPQDAAPCDDRTYEPSCIDGATQRRCNGGTRYTEEVVCDADEACKTSDLGGFCVPPDARACDPSVDLASCNGNVAEHCDLETHFTTERTCDGFYSLCVAEDDFMGTSIVECIRPDAPTCLEPLDATCLPTEVHRCIDGRRVTTSCGPFGVCMADPQGLPQCVIVTEGASCDAATYPTSCQSDLFTHCFGDMVQQLSCRDYGRRCDPQLGCVLP